MLAVEGPSAESFVRDYDGVAPFLVTEGEPCWTVRYDRDVLPLEGDTLLSFFTVKENDDQCRFSRKGDIYQYAVFAKSDGLMKVCMRYHYGSNEVEASSCSDFSTLRFSLWFAFSMLAASGALTFVHSSTIVYRGRAILFLGESGTGKSTHTRLWLKNISGSRLLNDDSPLLSVADKHPLVYGSPWSGKTPCYHPYHFPLAAVVRLSQAPYNEMRRLSTREAFGAIQPSMPPALMQDERFADMLIDMISDIISVVPFYHLACLPDADAALLSCRTIVER